MKKPELLAPAGTYEKAKIAFSRKTLHQQLLDALDDEFPLLRTQMIAETDFLRPTIVLFVSDADGRVVRWERVKENRLVVGLDVGDASPRNHHVSPKRLLLLYVKCRFRVIYGFTPQKSPVDFNKQDNHNPKGD